MAKRLLLAVTAICRLIVTVAVMVGPTELLRHLGLTTSFRLSTDPSELASAAVDFGLMSRAQPLAVLRPNSADDVARLVRMAYESSQGFPVSARGHGHSVNGQAEAGRGVVIQMGRRSHGGSSNAAAATDEPDMPRVNEKDRHVDVWGGELWVDVLRSTLEYGLAPRSWTDYLLLTVGGTLSNAGISGQAFNHGPQISNVYELDVVTGKGEIVTCSEEENEELFHGVLGGLGQFGIITRARITLEPAPQRTRWIRVLYSNFTSFARDQEMLISQQGKPSSERFDYVEGFVIADQSLINNWRSSFFSPRNPVKISTLGNTSSSTVLYCLEVTKNYFDSTPSDAVDQEVEALLKKLEFIPSTVFTTDVAYVEFLDRVHKAELKLRSKGLWEVPHPWLNLFIPGSRIADFDRGVFRGILGHNKTSGPILVYPMNRKKWDGRSSVAMPDEEVFYAVSLLRTALEDGNEYQRLEHLLEQNRRVLEFCRQENIHFKQYLPHYTTRADWVAHFGNRWDRFHRLKLRYDPKHILATGQRIFEPPALGSVPSEVAWS